MSLKTTGVSFAFAILATTAMASGVLAADLPSRQAPPVFVPPPPIPVFTWTGLYVGGQVGYEFGRSNALASNLVANGSSPSGIIGGAHIGYNFSTQSLPFLGGAGLGPLGSGGIIGIEGDVDGSDYRSTYALGGITDSTRQDIQGSIRGRLGFTVDRALFYATGGAAFGGLRNVYVNPVTGASDSLSHTKVGYTVGGGVEYAITNNWSLRAEYRYTDFGTINDNLANTTGGAVNVRHRETDNRVQAGFSYKFDTFSPLASPVVARY